MLKMLYRKLNKNKDYRFLDAEAYRKHSNTSPDQSIFKLSENAALKVDFCTVTETASLADIQYFKSRNRFSITENYVDQEFITVDSSPEKQVAPDFNYHSLAASANFQEIHNLARINLDATSSASNTINNEAYKPKLSLVSSHCLSQPKLGVFSDSKAYSAFLKSELSRLDVDIQHFNHPRTLNAPNNAYLAYIDAWIIFLSEEAEDNFLDDFFDRFIEKPTLFLVPKTGRKTSASSIKAFVQSLMPENVRS